MLECWRVIIIGVMHDEWKDLPLVYTVKTRGRISYL